jgi:hypothetical protein
MAVEGCELCAQVRDVCGDCGNPIAHQHDDENHNTGECGCVESRSLCWKTWGACVSPYAPPPKAPKE